MFCVLFFFRFTSDSARKKRGRSPSSGKGVRGDKVNTVASKPALPVPPPGPTLEERLRQQKPKADSVDYFSLPGMWEMDELDFCCGVNQNVVWI